MIRESLLIKDFREIDNILENIDWNFSSRGGFTYKGVHPFDCRRHHWFPATFIPEIPFTLIEVLTHPDAVVYDPWAGIGTTYFQALLLGRRPLVAENCQVAVEFMKSLLILFNPKLDLANVKENVGSMVENFNPGIDYLQELRSDRSHNVLIDELQKWYNPDTMNKLAYLFLMENSCRDLSLKAALRIAISAILKKVSSQDRGWGCIADNVIPKAKQIKNRCPKDVIQVFKTHVNRLLNDIQEHLKYVAPDYSRIYEDATRRESILHADIRCCRDVPDNSVDLVVTSPPYPNMTDYVKSQRLSYYWLGISFSGGKNKDLDFEIGARNKRHLKDSLDRYFKDLQMCNEALFNEIVEGGYLCLVMPLFGTTNQNDTKRRMVIQRVISELEKYFMKEKELERIVPTIRRVHNIKWATLEREKIHIFRKKV